jgi:hypothetical protein
MRIDEVDTGQVNTDPNKLLGLVRFLSGRADDTNAQKQISRDAFISAARGLGIMVTPDNLPELIAAKPLSNVLEPLDPQSDQIAFKGADIGPNQMSVPQAQQVVAQAAKSAMQRRK